MLDRFEIAALLREIAVLLRFHGENRPGKACHGVGAHEKGRRFPSPLPPGLRTE